MAALLLPSCFCSLLLFQFPVGVTIPVWPHIYRDATASFSPFHSDNLAILLCSTSPPHPFLPVGNLSSCYLRVSLFFGWFNASPFSLITQVSHPSLVVNRVGVVWVLSLILARMLAIPWTIGSLMGFWHHGLPEQLFCLSSSPTPPPLYSCDQI